MAHNHRENNGKFIAIDNPIEFVVNANKTSHYTYKINLMSLYGTLCVMCAVDEHERHHHNSIEEERRKRPIVSDGCDCANQIMLAKRAHYSRRKMDGEETE